MNALPIVSFGLCAFLTLFGSLTVVLSSDIRRGVVGLVATVAGSAACYAMLSAGFLALTQLAVCGGALALLYFVTLARLEDTRPSVHSSDHFGGARAALMMVTVGIAGAGVYGLFAPPRLLLPASTAPSANVTAEFGSIAQVGDQLFTHASVPLTLLAVMVLMVVLSVLALLRRHPWHHEECLDAPPKAIEERAE